MKNLILMRHADAHSQQIFVSDKARDLTPAGQKQVGNIAKQLKKMNCLPDALLCSPAKRAIQTTELLCQKLKINLNAMSLTSTLYSGNIEDILSMIQSLMLPSQRLFLIGHNPNLSWLAQKLCSAAQSIILPTAGVISLSFDTANWDDLPLTEGKLLFFIEPAHEAC